MKERLFESAVQEQQKTLPLDHVVKNECRGGIWHFAWREGVANKPLSGRNVPPLLPAANHGYKVGEERDKHGGKQVEVGGKNRLRDRIMYKSAREVGTEKHEGISRTRSERHSLEEQEMIQDTSSLSLCALRGLSRK